MPFKLPKIVSRNPEDKEKSKEPLIENVMLRMKLKGLQREKLTRQRKKKMISKKKLKILRTKRRR